MPYEQQIPFEQPNWDQNPFAGGEKFFDDPSPSQSQQPKASQPAWNDNLFEDTPK